MQHVIESIISNGTPKWLLSHKVLGSYTITWN